jgi:hypothetical protein
MRREDDMQCFLYSLQQAAAFSHLHVLNCEAWWERQDYSNQLKIQDCVNQWEKEENGLIAFQVPSYN